MYQEYEYFYQLFSFKYQNVTIICGVYSFQENLHYVLDICDTTGLYILEDDEDEIDDHDDGNSEQSYPYVGCIIHNLPYNFSLVTYITCKRK